MSDAAIVMDKVAKSYSMNFHHAGGIKSLLLDLPGQIKRMRSFRYEVFHELSLVIRRGETFGVIGNNGAGKSTMLGLIAGIIRPTSGTVEVYGRVSPMLELGAGFHPDLSGLDNIMLNGVLLGLPKRTVQQRIDEIVAFSELGEFIDQPVRVYSAGMLMRLGFSVVAHLDPDILLIDEVTAVGDIGFQEKCRLKIEQFKKDGVTIVLVSHNQEEVRALCDRVALIGGKALAALGTPEEVFAPAIALGDENVALAS